MYSDTNIRFTGLVYIYIYIYKLTIQAASNAIKVKAMKGHALVSAVFYSTHQSNKSAPPK